MVVKLNHISEENNIVEPFSNENYYLEEEKKTVWTLCWNCCHPFDEIVYGLPLKYVSGVFYTYGDFCSLECASRYALENFDNFHEVYVL